MNYFRISYLIPRYKATKGSEGNATKQGRKERVDCSR